jgi:hypothetical protein
MKYVPLILLAGMLVFFIWVVEVRGVMALVRQYEAESFRQVQGEVTSSEVTVTYGSKGSVYHHVHITYRYSVDGLDHYTGRRYRYDGHPTDEAGANAVVQAHPPHSAVTVYYNPANPADALLAPGVDNRDVSLLFLMTPICLFFMWLLWRAGKQTGWPWSGAAVAGGVKLIEENRMVTRLRLPRYDAISIGLLTTAGLLLLAGILLVSAFENAPPLAAGAWFLVGVLTLGGVVYAWFAVPAHSGRQDLVVDEASRTLQLPMTYGRQPEPPLGFGEITGVALDKIKHSGKRGPYYTYRVTLQRKNGGLEKLVELNQSRAEELAGWLRAKLGLAGESVILNPES